MNLSRMCGVFKRQELVQTIAELKAGKVAEITFFLVAETAVQDFEAGLSFLQFGFSTSHLLANVSWNSFQEVTFLPGISRH